MLTSRQQLKLRANKRETMDSRSVNPQCADLGISAEISVRRAVARRVTPSRRRNRRKLRDVGRNTGRT